MKKYICPNIENKLALFQYFMAGSLNTYTEEGDGEAANSVVFEEDDTDPSNGKNFWDE